jgi:hypothetical protein
MSMKRKKLSSVANQKNHLWFVCNNKRLWFEKAIRKNFHSINKNKENLRTINKTKQNQITIFTRQNCNLSTLTQLQFFYND